MRTKGIAVKNIALLLVGSLILPNSALALRARGASDLRVQAGLEQALGKSPDQSLSSRATTGLEEPSRLMGQPRVVVIQNSQEKPGIFGRAPDSIGLPVQRIKAYDPSHRKLIPSDPAAWDWENIAAVVVMGGPANVYENQSFPWLDDLTNLIRHIVVQQQVPYLGICLGCQLLARAVGGKVTPDPEAPRALELGPRVMNLTSAGKKHPLFLDFPQKSKLRQLHGDTVWFPDGATVSETEIPITPLLRGNRRKDIGRALLHSFAVGNTAVGILGHPEAHEAEVLDSWGDVPQTLSDPVFLSGVHTMQAADPDPELQQSLTLASRNWWEGVVAPSWYERTVSSLDLETSTYQVVAIPEMHPSQGFLHDETEGLIPAPMGSTFLIKTQRVTFPDSDIDVTWSATTSIEELLSAQLRVNHFVVRVEPDGFSILSAEGGHLRLGPDITGQDAPVKVWIESEAWDFGAVKTKKARFGDYTLSMVPGSLRYEKAADVSPPDLKRLIPTQDLTQGYSATRSHQSEDASTYYRGQGFDRGARPLRLTVNPGDVFMVEVGIPGELTNTSISSITADHYLLQVTEDNKLRFLQSQRATGKAVDFTEWIDLFSDRYVLLRSWDTAEPREEVAIERERITLTLRIENGHLVGEHGYYFPAFTVAIAEPITIKKPETEEERGPPAMAVSPDGRLLAMRNPREETTLDVWNVAGATAERIASLEGHTPGVFAGLGAGYILSIRVVAFSPDGKRIASGPVTLRGGDGSTTNTIMIWDAETGEAIANLQGDNASWGDLVFSPDGNRIAFADSSTSSFKVFDAEEGRLQFQYEADEYGVAFNMAFSPDGSSLAVGSNTGLVRIWDLATQKLSSIPSRDGPPVTAIAYHPNGNTLAWADKDGVHLWSVSAQSPIDTISSDPEVSPIFSLDYSPDGARLAGGGYGKKILLWDASSRQLEKELTTLISIPDVRFTPDSQFLHAIGGHRWQAWEVTTETKLNYPEFPSGGLEEGSIQANTVNRFATAAEQGTGVLVVTRGGLEEYPGLAKLAQHPEFAQRIIIYGAVAATLHEQLKAAGVPVIEESDLDGLILALLAMPKADRVTVMEEAKTLTKTLSAALPPSMKVMTLKIIGAQIKAILSAFLPETEVDEFDEEALGTLAQILAA